MTEQEQNQLRGAMNADEGGHGRIDLFSRRYQKHPRTGDSLHSV